MIINLKNNVTLDTLKNQLRNEQQKWSDNKYCPNKEEAAAQEALFLDEATSFFTATEMVKPTPAGFYTTVIFNTETANNESVVLRVSLRQCILNYKPSIPYKDIARLVKYLTLAELQVDEEDIYDLYSLEQIEKFIPLPDGTFKSGGPRRVLTFYYNALLEYNLVENSKIGELKDLGINVLDYSDGTHFDFKQGSGNTLGDLVEGGIVYEVKGPDAKPSNFLHNINKNKEANYILHYLRDNGGTLNLYKRNSDGSYTETPIASISLALQYPDLSDEVTDWDTFWNILNNQ